MQFLKKSNMVNYICMYDVYKLPYKRPIFKSLVITIQPIDFWHDNLFIYLYNILGFVRLWWCPVVLSIHLSRHLSSSVPSSVPSFVPMTTTGASLSLALNTATASTATGASLSLALNLSLHPSLAVILWPCPLSGLAKVTACL
jgi:hypothetical protein